MAIDRNTVIGILRVLQQCGGHALSEETLFQQINLSEPKAVSSQWLSEHLQHCVDKGWVDFKADAIDRRRKYFITEEGKIALANS